MSSSFQESLSLASLIAPFPTEEFRAQYWETKPLIVHREDRSYYGDLFTLQDFDGAVMRSPEYVKMANAETKKNKSYKPQMAPGLEAVIADMRDGGTIILDQLHHREPKLRALCRGLAPEFGHRLQTNLYLTPANGKGFAPHWDNHDVFILQVVGSKHWKIEKQRRVFPGAGDQMGNDGRELRGELMSFTLNQGDVVYIPRGFVHAAECGSEPSLHITLGVTAIFLEDFLYAAIKASVQRDERLRVALPLGFMQGRKDGVVNRAMAAFMEAADEPFLSAVLDQYRDELVRTFPLDVTGQVLDFFQPTPVTLTDVVGPRRGIVYRMHANDDGVRLNYGARSIVFPPFFRQALEFALSTPTYAVGDIKGELEDEERIVFVERLMQEGLVVRR